MVARFRRGGVDLVGWALPLRLSLLAVISSPVVLVLWVDIALHKEPLWLFRPVGLACSCFTVWNYGWVVRSWRKARDAERERIVRDVMET